MTVIETFQNLVAQVPELVQPLIVALAGAVPFVEGEGAAVIGIAGGIHAAVAIPAAIIGNFLCVAILVLLSAKTRSAIVQRSQSKQLVTAGGANSAAEIDTYAQQTEDTKRGRKFASALERYGVPGVSLLGPLLLPTQFTATMLAATGVKVSRILFWQGLAIVLWTGALGVIFHNVIAAVQ